MELRAAGGAPRRRLVGRTTICSSRRRWRCRPPRSATIGNGAEDDARSCRSCGSTPYAIFTAGFNSTGQPAISLPLHWSEDGLPIGVQLVAAYGREDLLIRVAAQLEQAQPWADRWPDLAAVPAG